MPASAKVCVRSHRDLRVWQAAMALTREIYHATEKFPKREMYGVVAQMRRSAISIPANIAEGHGRQTTREYLRFLAIAMGSLRELETYCAFALELKYLDGADATALEGMEDRIGRMLTNLREALRPKVARAPTPKSPIPNP
jgi:four helix bundle protein